ncbi:hypothetical protein B0X71_16485 [Planococcus lenghuensis]|uniref:Uncharacterized protein n=1 Tax=Planococcus lenghuensis TaxID=2213202 RepID=A0A1Q2L253_9BACL|nr:hypothetical protein B0X71_16485 [Planococcus lenghuensis]
MIASHCSYPVKRRHFQVRIKGKDEKECGLYVYDELNRKQPFYTVDITFMLCLIMELESLMKLKKGE